MTVCYRAYQYWHLGRAYQIATTSAFIVRRVPVCASCRIPGRSRCRALGPSIFSARRTAIFTKAYAPTAAAEDLAELRGDEQRRRSRCTDHLRSPGDERDDRYACSRGRRKSSTLSSSKRGGCRRKRRPQRRACDFGPAWKWPPRDAFFFNYMRRQGFFTPADRSSMLSAEPRPPRLE